VGEIDDRCGPEAEEHRHRGADGDRRRGAEGDAQAVEVGIVVRRLARCGRVVPGGTEVPLPVGSYWFQKGGERHITKCISPNECIFFISQAGRFDYVVSPATK